MDQTVELAFKYARTAWRRRWTAMIVAWLVCCLGWAGVHLIPNTYRSSAEIYVDTDAILTPLLHGLAVDVSPEQQVEMLQQTLLSTPNLQTLISKTDLGLTAVTPEQRELLIRTLDKKISVTPSPIDKNLFTISYSNSNPRLARDVVQTLLSIFTESATANNRNDMQNAQDFLTRQVASYQEQIHALEQRRAQFRMKYAGVVPEAGGGIENVPSARAEVQSTQLTLEEAEGREAMVKTEMARLFPRGLVGSSAGRHEPTLMAGASIGPTALAEAEAKLHEMETIYTNDYPGVIAQKKIVEALRKASGGGVGGGGGGFMSADLYTQMTMKLLDVQVTVATLKHKLELAQADLARIEKIRHEQPALLVQVQNMDREYSVLLTNYDQLVTRLQSAKLSQAANTQAEKVHLRVVDPPEIPVLPIGPNRPLLITAVLVFGMGAGVGVALLLALLDTSFSSEDDLRDLGVPVLGSLSSWGRRYRGRAAVAVAPFAVGAILLVLAYGELIVRTLHASA